MNYKTYEGRIRPSLIAARASRTLRSRPGRLRGANSPLPHCGRVVSRSVMAVMALRGANSPLPHCGPNSPICSPGKAPTLRGANSPLPHCGRLQEQLADSVSGPYEGRIRPSLIAAARTRRRSGLPRKSTRGEFAPPSLRPFHWLAPGGAGLPTRGEFAPPSLRQRKSQYHATYPPVYEGRIRPSLIAAGRHRRDRQAIRPLRGANSPLPHCGTAQASDGNPASVSTRGEFAPPSLRLVYAIRPRRITRSYEGRIRPSLIAACSWSPHRSLYRPPTRGEFAPPSLRHRGRVAPARIVRVYEGRIRPSLIAALYYRRGRERGFLLRGANSPLPHCGCVGTNNFIAEPIDYEGRIRPSLIAAGCGWAGEGDGVFLRGANSPLPHCGTRADTFPELMRRLRGANSPLPHCGPLPQAYRRGRGGGYEGRIRPSLIAAAGIRLGEASANPYEGRIRPSLIAAVPHRLEAVPQCPLRGANSPLPHCGAFWLWRHIIKPGPTRGEFAPPSLRHDNQESTTPPSGGYEGRIRPSLIAAGSVGQVLGDFLWLRGANSPLPHCGAIEAGVEASNGRTTRGEFAPPSLRLDFYLVDKHVNDGTTRGEFAPPSLRPGRGSGGIGRGGRYEGRIRPSLIAAWKKPNEPERAFPTTRGEFAPPSLRLPPLGHFTQFVRLRGANSPLPHCGR